MVQERLEQLFPSSQIATHVVLPVQSASLVMKILYKCMYVCLFYFTSRMDKYNT